MRRLILAVVVIALLVRHGRRGADFYSDFRDLSALDGRIAMLAKEHPDVAHARTLGTSGEGRPIEAVEVSRGGNTEIVIAGGQHAREWIAAMAPMCVAERLATEPRYRSLLERFSFVIVPVVNPDGYAYTWTTDRNWRKSRRDGHGVDLNRNYSLAWGGADSSDDKSASTYRGSAPFSEP
jgi:murein tripeptide amidase MpaA